LRTPLVASDALASKSRIIVRGPVRFRDAEPSKPTKPLKLKSSITRIGHWLISPVLARKALGSTWSALARDEIAGQEVVSTGDIQLSALSYVSWPPRAHRQGEWTS
jgi:hypothetical protein